MNKTTELIRELMEETGLRQAQVSKLSGMSPAVVSELCRGLMKVSLRSAVAFRRALMSVTPEMEDAHIRIIKAQQADYNQRELDELDRLLDKER